MADGDDFSDDDDLDMLVERDASRRESERVDDPHREDDNVENEENAEAGNEDEDSNKKAVAPKKKAVRNPQPKLNADRICGKQGIALLPKLFENTKFKGKGHEKEDLSKMLASMEHWGHRLFPQLPFDTVLDRIERLGKKKPVQVYIKKMRMGMLTEEDDRPIIDSDDGEDRNEETNAQTVARNTDDAFEELLREAPVDHNRSSYEIMSNNSSFEQLTPAPSKTSTLSEELRLKIERNKQLALEKKKARQMEAATSSMDVADEQQIEEFNIL